MLIFWNRKNQNVPAENHAAAKSDPAVALLSAGGTIEFLDGEDGVHIPLAISDAWDDERNGRCLSLQRTPGMFTLPNMEPGSIVSFYVFLSGSRPAICSGTVLSASRIKADIGKLSIEKLEERRGEFRLPVNGAVTLFLKEDTEKRDKFEASLINVSSDGMAFCTRTDMEEGSIYGASFRLRSDGSWITCFGQIIWSKPLPSGKKMYGMIFSLLDKQQKVDLIAEIYNAQRNMRTK